MTLVELLAALRSRDINVWADAERLRYSAPPGALTADIREEMVKRKAELLAFMNQTEWARRVSRAPISQISREGTLPLSINQRRLWFIEQLQPNAAFNSYKAFRITGSLNVAALEESVNEVVRRHEALRTTFSALDGEPFQVIAPVLKVRIPSVDLSGISDATERQKEAEKILAEEIQRPFDLARGPLFCAQLLRLGADEHVLLLTMHHIVTDGWSMGILIKELTVLYEAFCNGNPSPLPELPIQYVDFSHWQLKWLQGEGLQQELSYWKERLKGAPELTALPTDYARPPVQTFQGASEPLVISKSLTEALKALSKAHGVTLFMTLLAAFKALLYRYTGQEDLIMGSPIAGRIRSDVENLIGLFINTLLLRTDLSGNPTFRELLKCVREVALEAYAHQEVPFEKLIQDLHLERTLSFSSFFQVMFVLQNTPAAALKLSGTTVTPLAVKRETSLSDLFLSLVEREEGLYGTLSYRTELFDIATIRRMIGNFQVLLEGIVVNPDRPIAALPLLSETERHQLLVEWNDTRREYPREKCIHHLFEEQVEKSPGAVAVVSGQQRLTYHKLNQRSNQLAHYLCGLGVGPETFVGICVERSVEMAVGLLGILKAGAAYVPLDPQYPKGRLEFMLEDAQPRVLLTQQRFLKELFEGGGLTSQRSEPGDGRPAAEPLSAKSMAHSVENMTGDGLFSVVDGLSSSHGSSVIAPWSVVCLDSDWPAIARESQSDPETDVQPDHPAYVVYTSGSTGRPKGVLISHRGVINHSLAVSRYFALEQSDRVAQCASLNFDISVEEIFPSWTIGAAVILCPPDRFFPGPEWSRWVEEEEITVVNLPTAFWHEWVHELEQSQQLPPSTLRLVVVGGEQASVQVLAKWRRLVRFQLRWVNTYGPTEATVTTTVYEADADLEIRDTTAGVPIGRAISNSEVYVLDPYLQPVPVGIAGELYIGGEGLARGYLNQPQLTAETFIANPFGREPGARLYKTGDRVRCRPDGNLEFVGRFDYQVKIRGFRIELGEIEAALLQHPAVRDTVVLAREGNENPKSKIENLKLDKRLVAYLVAKQEPPPTASELRSFLKEKLPSYMIPSAFVFLASLPLTSTGKVNRRELPALDRTGHDPEMTFVAPRTPTESTIAEIWRELLGVERVGIHDDFFELGGHSLLATQVVSRLRKALQMDLPLRALFEEPTVARLSEHVATIQSIKTEGQRDTEELSDETEEIRI